MSEVELPNPEELEEVKAKTFTRRVALVTAVFAVILAITSLGGNNAMKEMLAQQQSSDQWAFYQAKVIREHLYKIQKMQAEAALAERGGSMKPEVRAKIESLMKKAAEEETRYKTEKKEIEAEAKKLERERDVNQRKDPTSTTPRSCSRSQSSWRRSRSCPAPGPSSTSPRARHPSAPSSRSTGSFCSSGFRSCTDLPPILSFPIFNFQFLISNLQFSISNY